MKLASWSIISFWHYGNPDRLFFKKWMQKPSPLLTEYDWHIQSWHSWSTCRREAANFCVWKSTTWRHIPWDICEAMDAVTKVFEAKIGTSDFRLRWPFLRFEHHKFLKAEIYCHHLQIFAEEQSFWTITTFFSALGKSRRSQDWTNKKLVKNTQWHSDFELPFISDRYGFSKKSIESSNSPTKNGRAPSRWEFHAPHVWPPGPRGG